ncbi:MAG: type IV toxin-antitoxin system AbiEi family antitoxin domain-containing protein [Acidobacteriota bacterium]
MRSNLEVNRRLHSVAGSQAGFFTTKQAKNAGFSESSHTYHVQAGHWTRVSRGIYRLTGFPEVLRPELVRWHLWAMDRMGRPQGVYSHFTALELYAAPETPSPDVPSTLHMTVPPSFRRMGATPEGLTLHYAKLAESEIAEGNGYRLTAPLRTILDLAAGEMAAGSVAAGEMAAEGAMLRAELSKALLEMVERRLITRSQVKSAKVPEVVRLQLEQLLGLKKR